ncbi:MAG: putative type I restriction enzymeP M protein [Dehalococcoidia bacterium]|nr:putative type I restriction enzymeP M protein [Chloroflexota bacterium]
MFTLSQVYEGLLQKMGEKNNDGGQFFTPREVIRAMIKVIDPEIGETVYDPGCGTGGFLAQAFLHMSEMARTGDDFEALKTRTFYGREKENLVYPIALANLVLHEIDEPHIWHGNTLTGLEIYGGLFQGAPGLFDVVLTNPPFGGKEGKDAQTRFAYKTSATQVLFLQHVIDSLKPGGRCGIVMDEGALFRTSETAFVQTKRKLLNECDVFCIISLPPKVFLNAGAASKTNLIFFTKGEPTREVWYYDLSDLNITKKQPLTLEHFEEFFKLFNPLTLKLSESERSWCVPIEEIEAKNYDLKAVNPNRKNSEDDRTPAELIAVVELEAKAIRDAITKLTKEGI